MCESCAKAHMSGMEATMIAQGLDALCALLRTSGKLTESAAVMLVAHVESSARLILRANPITPIPGKAEHARAMAAAAVLLCGLDQMTALVNEAAGHEIHAASGQTPQDASLQ